MPNDQRRKPSCSSIIVKKEGNDVESFTFVCPRSFPLAAIDVAAKVR